MTSRRAAVVATAAAAVVVLAALVLPIVDRGWLGGFRLFMYPDQLSYAAIASNISAGDLGWVEPFTRTGSLFYASGWYQLIGLLSLVTGMPVHLAWTVLGLLIVSCAVAVSGWTAFRISARSWAPLLVAAALLTGTLATVLTGRWLVTLDSHAVLWGPLSTLFTLNAEVAGLCVVAIAINAVHLSSRSRRHRTVVLAGAGFAIGLTAMIHTYAFIAGTLVGVTLATAWGLLHVRSGRRLALTTVLVSIVLVLGPWLAGIVGPLPVFGLLLVAFLPGWLPTVRTAPRIAVWVVAAYGVAAAPQVLRIGWGFLTDDPFLAYRALSTASLGVPVIGGLIAALVFVLAAALCALVLAGSGQTMQQALLAALAVSAVLLSQNDRWGFNQEPYRFWIAFTVLAALTLTPVLAWSLANLRASRSSMGARVLVVLVAATWVLSIPDGLGSSAYAREQGVLAMDDSRATALRALVADTKGLVLSSRCIPPSWLANLTDADVAFYNRGLAWPANADGLEPFLDLERRAGEDPILLERGGVSYVLTSSACPQDWNMTSSGVAQMVATESYDEAGAPVNLALWRVVHSGT